MLNWQVNNMALTINLRQRHYCIARKQIKDLSMINIDKTVWHHIELFWKEICQAEVRVVPTPQGRRQGGG